MQKEGQDYENTYAPTVRSDTSRVLLGVSASLDYKIRQFDIITAFLNSKMDKRIYTTQPKGFEQGDRQDLACLLNMALYGLVQSAYLWFEEFKEKLLLYGLVQSQHDDALFYDTARNLYVTVYVDDVKVFCPESSTIDDLKVFLSKHYKLRDLGEVEWYLGMEINRTDGVIILTQTKYINDLLQKHGMQDCSPASTPMMEARLKKAPDGYICEPQTLKEYQTLLGGIMHLMVITRPDLAYSISRLAEFSSNPTDDHWKVLKRVLRYLQGTKDLGLCYTRAPGLLSFSAWTDASWGEDPDDSRSTSGFVILLASGPVAYKSQKQQSVALSSTEAEYMGQTLAATNVMWVRGLLKELEIEGTVPKGATIIYADNQGAIKLAENPVFQKRSKHIAIRYHYIRDLIKQGDISLEYRSTKEMIADGLTKPLGPIAFKEFIKSLGLTTVAAAIAEPSSNARQE